MNTKQLLLSALAVSLFLSSCKKEEDEAITELPSKAQIEAAYLTGEDSKSWKWVRHTQDGKDIQVNDCGKNLTINFNTDGTRKIDIENPSCEKSLASTSKEYYNKWELYSNNDSIRIELNNSNDAIKYKVKKLTSKHLIIESDIVVSGLDNKTDTITLEETYVAIAK